MRDFSQWGNPKQFYLAKELSTITDCVIWHEPGNINDILSKIRFVPDFILIFFYKSVSEISPPISGLSSLRIPCGVFLMDLHNLNNLSNSILEDKINYIFTCYRDSFCKRFPQLINRMRWLPNHVNTEIFKDYKLPKEIEMLMMGAVSKTYYPLRDTIRKSLSGNPSFVYHKHPGSREVKDNKNVYVKEKYAMEINKAKLFFTCDSKYHYPILKYFESLACNTLLLAPDSREIYDLGFRTGENFVAINEKNFLENAEYYLRNDKERERIAENGYKFVHERHSTAQRAKELLKMIVEILAG
jgi:glycosyltransferase involved in cell wall biosynthesis